MKIQHQKENHLSINYLVSKSDILNHYEKNTTVSLIAETFISRKKIAVSGLTGSALSFVVTALFKKSELPFYCSLTTKKRLLTT